MRCASLAVAAILVVAAVPASVAAHDAAENDPPLADAGLDQHVERGTVVWLDGGGSLDPDGELVAHEWAIRTPDGREIEPSDPTAVSTTFTASTVGRYEVTLTVTDDHGVERSDTLYVDVAAPDEEPSDTESGESTPQPNEPPTGEIGGPDSVVRGETATFTADVYDPDGEITSYAWSDGQSTREVDRIVDLPAGETFAFSVRVTDDDGATETFRKSVRVLASNDATGSTTDDSNEGPTARIAGPDRVASGHEATFVLRGSDPDGTVVRRLWPDRSETGATVERTFTETGTYTLRGVVVDDDGARATATKTVEVYDEGPPVVSIDGPDTAPMGSTQEYTLEAYDPDGGELTISWEPPQNQLERKSNRYVNNVGIDGLLGDTVEVSATVTDDEGNTVTAVKETNVETQTSFGTGEAVPYISEISSRYATDDTKQTSETDSVELGTYEFLATVTHEEPKIVRATWRINDTNRAVVVDTLGRFSGTRDTGIRHMFVSEHGGKVTREVSLSAIDADGDRDEQKWISRVHSVQTHDDIVFYAMKSGDSARKHSLKIEPGVQVTFIVGSNQNYRLTFGDGSAARGSGTSSLRNVEIAHTYDDPGAYKARLISTQGPNGEALKTVDINVRPKTYTEYWYERTGNTIERVISEDRPSGKDWFKRSVYDSGTYFTGRTVSVRADAGRPSMLGDNWVSTGTSVEQRSRRITRVRQSDPDGAGDDWQIVERNVRTEERTYYEDKYQWLSSKFQRPGWSYTGETRTDRVVVGDGHNHDRERHTRTTRTCTNWDLDPSPYGGFSRECSNWRYDTDVWYTGHDHSGYTYYDTDYLYKTEVERTRTVHYHEYASEREFTVTTETFAETESWTEWLWEREGRTVKQEHSLKKPETGSYISGTLRTVEVRCGSEESNHDSVMC
ncbi:PKD domain-containing protein [Halobaculum magnesiiphilum]|uniref:PKD domain-containing protein n=1 Tax=Halobaculum magnesiiphilum TaxID=1017351 RepID=A0A8T8WEI3_9EURY|nr:PKD domain-containing protein [Halobaculum magnesiiphilum]